MKIFLILPMSKRSKQRTNHLIDGVTTNPSLIAKSGRQPIDVYRQLADMGIPDISMEVMGDFDGMLVQGMELAKEFGDVATIKLPMTVEGLQVCDILSKRRVRTIVTLVFNTAQAFLAAKRVPRTSPL